MNKFIEEKATKILSELNIEKCDFIDVYKIAKHYGIDVQPEVLEDSISGVLILKEDNVYIRYNKSHDEKRQRFTISHELGHFFLHSRFPIFVDKGENRLYRNQDSSTGELKKEREANAFAAALLMPKSFIEYEINLIEKNVNSDAVEYLAKKFNVSIQAMSFRLANLGYGLF
ncbi:MAG: ImmA/IrrE family metallo-endopeptidase [Flavobacteriales bacterium]|jgi:Zn-dependent peptidase ImmA (M78 family)|nr:ImmA/IrrE family metallo-endopeptidase [Flavobacteriales bacterium]